VTPEADDVSHLVECSQSDLQLLPEGWQRHGLRRRHDKGYPDLTLLYDREKQKRPCQSGTAVARKSVAYLLAADRGKKIQLAATNDCMAL
jgi:hypothetical protein